MDLKTFVKQALLEIMDGVGEASCEAGARNPGGVISPRLHSASEAPGMVVAAEDGGGMAFLVDFDISVAAAGADRTAADGGVKLRVASALPPRFDGGVEDEAGHLGTQRLRFSVPIKFPQKAPEVEAAPAPVAQEPARPQGWIAY